MVMRDVISLLPLTPGIFSNISPVYISSYYKLILQLLAIASFPAPHVCESEGSDVFIANIGYVKYQ